MKTAMTTVLLGATFVAACDSTPTSPDASRTRPQEKPAAILGLGASWSATKLPFQPLAINDAGAIVGVQDVGGGVLRAVVWRNGVTTQLPLPQGTDNHCVGNTVATAISPSGIVAGKFGDCLVQWNAAALPIYVLFPGSMSYNPLAVYDNGTMLGSAQSVFTRASYGFQIVTGSGFSGLSPAGFNATAVDGQGNVYGSTSSGYPARWSQAYGLSNLTVLAGFTGGGVNGADGAGDALGSLHDAFGNLVPVKWSVNGSVTTLAGLPANPSYLNSSGRIVGYARFSATQQAQVWTSMQGALTVLASPDTQPYTAMGVNSCGSIIASAGFSLTGAMFRRTSLTGVVCDQAPVALAQKISAPARISQ